MYDIPLSKREIASDARFEIHARYLDRLGASLNTDPLGIKTGPRKDVRDYFQLRRPAKITNDLRTNKSYAHRETILDYRLRRPLSKTNIFTLGDQFARDYRGKKITAQSMNIANCTSKKRLLKKSKAVQENTSIFVTPRQKRTLDYISLDANARLPYIDPKKANYYRRKLYSENLRREIFANHGKTRVDSQKPYGKYSVTPNSDSELLCGFPKLVTPIYSDIGRQVGSLGLKPYKNSRNGKRFFETEFIPKFPSMEYDQLNFRTISVTNANTPRCLPRTDTKKIIHKESRIPHQTPNRLSPLQRSFKHLGIINDDYSMASYTTESPTPDAENFDPALDTGKSDNLTEGNTCCSSTVSESPFSLYREVSYESFATEETPKETIDDELCCSAELYRIDTTPDHQVEETYTDYVAVYDGNDGNIKQNEEEKEMLEDRYDNGMSGTGDDSNVQLFEDGPDETTEHPASRNQHDSSAEEYNVNTYSPETPTEFLSSNDNSSPIGDVRIEVDHATSVIETNQDESVRSPDNSVANEVHDFEKYRTYPESKVTLLHEVAGTDLQRDISPVSCVNSRDLTATHSVEFGSELSFDSVDNQGGILPFPPESSQQTVSGSADEERRTESTTSDVPDIRMIAATPVPPDFFDNLLT